MEAIFQGAATAIKQLKAELDESLEIYAAALEALDARLVKIEPDDFPENTPGFKKKEGVEL
jgi:hypothetical protein